MYKIKASIVGLSPLRYNRFLIRSKDQTNKKKMTHDDQVEDALERSYRDEKGFYVPKEALRAAIINGGKKVKIGRGAASKLLEAILIFEEDKYYVGTDKYKIQQDVVRIPPKTGARIVQYWVVIEKWGIEFEAVIPDTDILESVYESGDHYIIESSPKNKQYKYPEFLRFAPFIYSQSRATLFNYINRLPNGKDDVYKINTDSFTIDRKHLHIFQKYIKDRVGCLKVE